MKAQILFFTAYFPGPIHGGAPVRSSNTIKALSRLGDVHILVYSNERAADRRHSVHPDLAKEIASLLSIGDLDSDVERFWAAMTEPALLRRLLISSWITAGRMIDLDHQCSRRLANEVARRCGVEAFDLVVAFQGHLGAVLRRSLQYLKKPQGVSVLDWDAAEKNAASEQTRLRFGDSALARLRRFVTDFKNSAFEEANINTWDISIFASSIDQAYFGNRYPGRTFYCYPNCVAIEEARPAESAEVAPVLLFVANFSYWPNRDGARTLVEEIWPRIRSRLPKARLMLVGAGPDNALLAENGRNGITVTGRVGNLTEYYRQAHLCLAPMRFSVGSSIKILEAMAFRRPVLAFPEASTRHGLTDGVNVAVVESNAEFADRAVDLILNYDKAQQMADRGYAFVQESFEATVVQAKFADFLMNALVPGPEHQTSRQ